MKKVKQEKISLS